MIRNLGCKIRFLIRPAFSNDFKYKYRCDSHFESNLIPSTTVFLLPYFALDLFCLGLYGDLGNIMGIMIMPATSKYKSIGVSVDTYNKIIKIADKERRNISQQLSLLVDQEYSRQNMAPTGGGISVMIEED